MKKFLFFMILSIGLVFASCKKETPDPGYFAGIAAKGYYDLLLEGKYNDFVAGYNQPNRISKGYHEQLLLNARMFMEQQQEEFIGKSIICIYCFVAVFIISSIFHILFPFLSLFFEWINGVFNFSIHAQCSYLP